MNDFDFFAGRWNVVNRRLVDGQWDDFPGHSVATRHFDGAASFDEITFPTKGSHGLTVRVYNPETRQWSIYWASSALGVLDTRPMVGAFEGDPGRVLRRGDLRGQAGPVPVHLDRHRPGHRPMGAGLRGRG
ncbi:hypothetical protein [Nonomuraea turkmeniaca]|uniref:hypothetical protein n=1 Tax=Nonomuraea turkmeniaca TaxID=103838 RepID=UPI001FE56817|nr:hypothetical protein [Nonomuraea turkmeniaca]